MSEQAYYNEIEPFAGDWLENLIASKQITAGKVDRRSITDVQPADVAGFQRCHFFAGIAGWDLALSLAGWDGPVWTASCPCQPFSTAGKQKGTQDERHLWPVQFGLIDAVRPPVVFGEQVSSAIGHGWLDGVFADLEGAGYTCGAAVLGAHSVGAPHIRQRLYWFGCRLFDANGHGREAWRSAAETNRYGSPINSAGSRLRDSASDQQQLHRKSVPVGIGEVSIGRSSSGLGDCVDSRLERHAGDVLHRHEPGRNGTHSPGSVAASGAWSDYTIGQFRDGKYRRIGCGVQPLAHGIPRDMGRGQPELASLVRRASGNRKGRLKGYGNAIVPQDAAIFIRAVMDWMEEAT